MKAIKVWPVSRQVYLDLLDRKLYFPDRIPDYVLYAAFNFSDAAAFRDYTQLFENFSRDNRARRWTIKLARDKRKKKNTIHGNSAALNDIGKGGRLHLYEVSELASGGLVRLHFSSWLGGNVSSYVVYNQENRRVIPVLLRIYPHGEKNFNCDMQSENDIFAALGL